MAIFNICNKLPEAIPIYSHDFPIKPYKTSILVDISHIKPYKTI